MISVLTRKKRKKVFLLFFGFCLLAGICSFPLLGEQTIAAPTRQYHNVESFSVAKIDPLDAPGEYTFGSYIENGEFISLGALDGDLNPNFFLKKYIVLDREGKVVSKLDRVLLWNRYGVILKLNPMNYLLYINAHTKQQKIVNLDTRLLRCLCFNPSTRKLLYMLSNECIIHQYDIARYQYRPLARLDRDNIFGLHQLTDNIILYIRPQITRHVTGKYVLSLSYSVKLPLFITNLKTFEESQVALISGNGFLSHFNQSTDEIVFVVEENGYFKSISSHSPNHPKKIPLSSLNKYDENGFHGLVLTYSSMHPDGNFIAISRLKLRRLKKNEPEGFEFFDVDSDSFAVEESDIYILDIKGNYKQLTNTPDQSELVQDWSHKGDEILYYDHKNKKFHILKLDTLL